MMKHPGDHLTPAQCLVHAFKGVRAAGRAIKRTPSTICSMVRRGQVPPQVQAIALRLAEEQGLNLSARDLILGRAVEAPLALTRSSPVEPDFGSC